MKMTLLILFLLVLICAAIVADGWSAFGKTYTEASRSSFESLDHYEDGRFRNKLPLRNYTWRSIRDSFSRGNYVTPTDDIAIQHQDGSLYQTGPATGLRITWLGHSTLLVEMDDANLLIDPVWGERASPFSWAGPKRWYEPPLAIEDLPRIDAVLISHDHYDHLDEPTIKQLIDVVPTYIVPLGVGSHLAYWGVPEEVIQEVSWWEEIDINSVQVTSTPARHASGRHLLDLNKTLWSGYALKGTHSVYYSGDTGLFPGFKEIGERLGPFDVTMIEVGAYNRNWPDWHLGPEQAVVAHQWVQGSKMLPLHWGLFNLALHNWTEPMERVLLANEASNTPVLTPRPGQAFEPGNAMLAKWWPDLPWEGPDQHAVMSTQLDPLQEHEENLINGSATAE